MISTRTWQPIEGHPNHDKLYLIKDAQRERGPILARWDDDEHCWEEMLNGGGYALTTLKPTHWIEVPESSEAIGTAGGA